MPIVYECIDGIEPVSDSVAEQFGNIANYNVVSGCAVTYSASDMVATIASGVITHNGSSVTVAGNTVTLVSDPTNPRWTWIYVNSSGTAAIVSGDPLAVPSVPELGDNVALALVKVEAAQTIANSITYKLDKRIMAVPVGLKLVGSNTVEATMTSATAADMVTVTGLSIPATTPVMIVINARNAAAAHTPSVGLKINATTVVEATYGGSGRILDFPATNEVQDGAIVLYLAPRRTSYARGLTGTASVSGASGLLSQVVMAGNVLTASIPIATITDVIIRGDSDGTNVLGIQGVYVYTMGV